MSFFRIPTGYRDKPLTFPGFAIGRRLLVLGATGYGYIGHLPKTLITLLKIICRGKFYRFLRSKMTAGLLAVKMGLGNEKRRMTFRRRFVATLASPQYLRKRSLICFLKGLIQTLCYNTTGTLCPGVTSSGRTRQSNAAISTPAFAARRRASPKAGSVASLGEKAVTPSI